MVAVTPLPSVVAVVSVLRHFGGARADYSDGMSMTFWIFGGCKLIIWRMNDDCWICSAFHCNVETNRWLMATYCNALCCFWVFDRRDIFEGCWDASNSENPSIGQKSSSHMISFQVNLLKFSMNFLIPAECIYRFLWKRFLQNIST